MERVAGLRPCCQATRARPSGAGKMAYKEAVRGRRKGWSGGRHGHDRRGLSNGNLGLTSRKKDKEKPESKNL